MTLLRLAWMSLLSRRLAAGLTVFSIMVSVALLAGVDELRGSVRQSFLGAVAGTDLIVGARTGSVPLLLSSVFRIGEPQANFDWETFEALAARPEVAWAIPISLGDSHRGFRVVGTDSGYFEHFRHGGDEALRFAAGRPFAETFEAVVGANVAGALHYELGQEINLNHGIGSVDLAEHSAHPFVIVGILSPTGTPVDRAVHVPLQGIEAVHEPPAGQGEDQDHLHAHEPSSVTAAFLGLNSPIDTLVVQRDVNLDEREPLTAIVPGLALLELFQLTEGAENALLLISGCVVVVSLVGMVASIVSTLNERRREIAVLRAIGAGPRHGFALLLFEAVVLGAAGAILGVLLVRLVLGAAQPLLMGYFGIAVDVVGPRLRDLYLVCAVILAAAIAACIPATMAYLRSLGDGLSPKA